LPFHLQIITSFVHSNNFPPVDPTYNGSRFTYPFLSDLVAALFTQAGASLSGAQFLENVLLAFALIGLLYRWGLETTGDRAAAALTPILVLFSGGLGWCSFLRDAFSNSKGP